MIRSGVGLSRQIAGDEPRNSSPDLFRVPCLTHPRKRVLRPQVVTRTPRKTYFGPPKKSLVPGPDFDIMPRNPDTSRGGNRGDPASAEKPEPSCSSEGLVTPLLGTQSLMSQNDGNVMPYDF